MKGQPRPKRTHLLWRPSIAATACGQPLGGEVSATVDKSLVDCRSCNLELKRARKRGHVSKLPSWLVRLRGAFKGAAAVLIVALAALLVGCAPSPSRPRHFFLVFHNRSNFPQKVEVVGARDGVYASQGARGEVAANADGSFVLADAPELVEVRAGWGAVAWSGSEIAGSWVFHVSFPDGASWKGWSQ